MEINYTIVIPVVILVIIVIVFLIIRNRKDKQRYEKEMIDSEIKPEPHTKDKI